MRMRNTRLTACKSRSSRAGFTLIETVVAVVILAVGILSLAAMLARSLTLMSVSKYEFIAQQKAAEAVESIYTARDTSQLSWTNINNVAQGGIFIGGPTQLCDPGPDGIVGTADDNCLLPDAIILPGPDGKIGTADDIRAGLSDFKRTITITAGPNGLADLRTITIAITYRYANLTRTYTLITYISKYT
jgi:prepilin-type N-terminal cleavage/methylation domain-containing protein